MSKEEIEAKVAAILQPETVANLKSSVWKERVKGKPPGSAAVSRLAHEPALQVVSLRCAAPDSDPSAGCSLLDFLQKAVCP